MNKIIVTVWGWFVDIDGFACAIAYSELLRLEWKESIAVLLDPINASITSSLLKMWVIYSQEKQEWEYVIVDMSDPEKIASFALLDNIIEIYDHHFGFEEYWKERLWEKSKIEPIGAAATLIWEEYKKRGFADRISPESAVLLAHAIISNTVNFISSMTHERDKIALAELEIQGNLSKDWKERYFQEQQGFIEANVEESILNDTKKCNFPSFWPHGFWQMEIWDTSKLLSDLDLQTIFKNKGYDQWIFNCIDIGRKETNIVSNNMQILALLSSRLGIPVQWNTIHLNRVLLRKEILPLISL